MVLDNNVVQWNLTTDVLQSLIWAFIYCCLDNCNSVLTGIAKNKMKSLQALQNAAACLVSRAHHHDHAIPLLHDLHWLPVGQQVIFKIAVLI